MLEGFYQLNAQQKHPRFLPDRFWNKHIPREKQKKHTNVGAKGQGLILQLTVNHLKQQPVASF